MAQTLEKIFLQKVAQMPPEEQEIVVPVAKNSHKKGASMAAGTLASHGAGVWDPKRVLRPFGGSDFNGNWVSLRAQRSWRA